MRHLFSSRKDIPEVLVIAKRLTRRALGQLYWETYAPVFALAVLFIGLFCAASFSGVWERSGDPWRLITLIATLIALGLAIWRARSVRRPNVSAARRRVEMDSGVAHRPLDTIHDKAAISAEVWPQHVEKAVTTVKGLRASKLRPAMAQHDKYYLRYALPCVIILSMMVGFGDNGERLRRALTPTWQAGINPGDVTFEAWIDPPDYTGRPPVYLNNQRRVEIPAGSELVARMSGAKSAPRLKLTTPRDNRYLDVARIDPKTFEARQVLNEKSSARWRIGSRVQKWSLVVLPDRPPTLKFDETPKADKRDRLVVTYTFEDDYGVETLELHLRRLGDDIETGSVEIVTIPLQATSVRRVEIRETELDLTKHIWAGQKVVGRLVARDGLGQEARSAEEYFTIPDKIFIESLAKAVIENRQLILANTADYAPVTPLKRREWADQPWFDTYDPRNRLDRAPAEVQRAAALIDAVTDKPAGLFEDPAVFMGLENVLSRLRYAREKEELVGIPEDLWLIAIRAEFGLLGTALEEMREAERNLRDGMARRAPQREVDTLFDRYNEAVDRYMDELRKTATIAKGEGGSGTASSMDEIEELLKAIEEANRIGDTEGARKALARLAELLENMKIQLTMGEGQGDGESLPGELTEEMKKALEDMADLLGEQRELKDETEQAERQQEQGAQPGQENGAGSDSEGNQGDETLSPEELAARQRALEEAVERMAEALPEGPGVQDGETGGAGEEDSETRQGGGGEENPESDRQGGGKAADEALKDAANAMERSRNALSDNELEAASKAQADAISALRQAGESLADMAERQQRDNDGEGPNANPLGKNNNGVNDDQFEADVDPLDKATRSRELLEELRRRAAEQEREKIERDYLERLLKRF